MKTFIALLMLLAIATITLAAPLGTTADLHKRKQQQQQEHASLQARQIDEFNTAVAGPPGPAELGWIFGALALAWVLVAVGIVVLRKKRTDFMKKGEKTQEIKGRWEDTDSGRESA